MVFLSLALPCSASPCPSPAEQPSPVWPCSRNWRHWRSGTAPLCLECSADAQPGQLLQPQGQPCCPAQQQSWPQGSSGSSCWLRDRAASCQGSSAHPRAPALLLAHASCPQSLCQGNTSVLARAAIAAAPALLPEPELELLLCRARGLCCPGPWAASAGLCCSAWDTEAADGAPALTPSHTGSVGPWRGSEVPALFQGCQRGWGCPGSSWGVP